jgi:hypothetical protein
MWNLIFYCKAEFRLGVLENERPRRTFETNEEGSNRMMQKEVNIELHNSARNLTLLGRSDLWSRLRLEVNMKQRNKAWKWEQITVSHCRVQWWNFVETVMKLRIPQKQEKFELYINRTVWKQVKLTYFEILAICRHPTQTPLFLPYVIFLPVAMR